MRLRVMAFCGWPIHDHKGGGGELSPQIEWIVGDLAAAKREAGGIRNRVLLCSMDVLSSIIAAAEGILLLLKVLGGRCQRF